MPSSSDPERRLVVATYNVHACVGVDRRYDPDRIAAVIRELGADIVALQEVAARDRRGTLIDEFAYLAKATGFEAVPGPSLVDRRGQFGNVLLTRRPAAEVRRIDLSVPGRESRGALDVDLVVGGKGVRVIATHLGLRLWERRRQVARLLETLAADGPADHEREHEDRHCVLLGDLNEWRHRRGCLGPLKAAFGSASPAAATFPSWRPMLALDRILAPRSAASVDLRAHRSPLAAVASDHLPLRAVLTWE